jgi:carbonic anhydrase
MNETQNRLSQHTVQNLVISCIDFRFNNDLYDAVKKTFGISDFDEIKLAGGAGNLGLLGEKETSRQKTVLDDVALATKAHHVTDVYLLTHQNCGAYAMAGHAFSKELGADEQDFHTRELTSAKQTIATHFPDVTVHTGFVHVLPDNSIAINVN